MFSLVSIYLTHNFSFFFYCYSHHRDLHSFPTRRSSDLHAGPSGLRTGSGELICQSHTRGAARQSPATVSTTIVCARSNWQSDRKSTRLNSSHRCISYAVFCLKKKTTNNDLSLPLHLLLS